jgi:hypothetical protein
MNDRRARLHAISEWLMEFSVLWAVFPLLDQLIERTPIRFGLTTFSYGISVVAAVGGILLRKGDST